MQGSYGASLVIRALGTWALFNGVAIILGGTARWGNPAYDIVNLMPGSPYTWAIILLLGGSLVMYGSMTARYLPWKQFKYSRVAWDLSVPGKYIGTKDVTIDWGSEQFRNAGLKIIGAWFLLFGLAFVVTIFQLPDIGYGFGSRDILLAVICVIMTKVREPNHANSA